MMIPCKSSPAINPSRKAAPHHALGGTDPQVQSCATMAAGDDHPPENYRLSKQEIETMRRERDALALRIRQSQETIERSKDLLRRLDQILAAYDS
jgi:hypothetical protein